METRGRKRAEATSAAPSTAAPKRPRRTTATAVSSAAVTGDLPVSNRSHVLNDSPAQMDSTNESSGSAARGGGRRRKNHVLDSNNDGKGKEKEHEVRVDESDIGLGLNSDDNNSEDDYINDSDSAGILHQNLTSANSALQGLLRKLGAGLDDLRPSASVGSISHQSGKMKKMLTGLRANGEDGKQIEALMQLCEILSIGTEVSLSTFSVDSFVPVLVGLLSHERNPDIMLLAARALTHLCDVLPSSCALVVQYGAVSHFCARLLTIEYMDLAEQSLQALKKISVEHPTVCLRAGALMAVLSYLDFFSTGVQRVALATAANICKQLPSDAADFVMEVVPLLTNLLQYHDSKVLDHASDCLTRIAEAFASSPDKLDELCNHGLVAQAASLISISNSGGGQTSIDTSAYTGLLRLLSTCASGSPLCSNALLLLGISGILKDILSVSDNSASMFVSPALSRPQDQIFEIVNLVNELLPPLPQGTITFPASSNVFVRTFIKESSASSSAKQDDLCSNYAPEVSAREKLLTEQPELLQKFGLDIFPILIQIYGSSVNAPVRHKCLSAIGKLMYFSNADMIQSLLSVTNISSFVAGVLAWKDPYAVIPALQIAEILMEKLPEIFSKMFLREGVVHAIVALVLPEFSTEKDKDCIAEGASRTRQNRRRICNSNSDVNSREVSRSSVSVSISSPPSSIEIPSVNLYIRTAVSAKAKAFKDKYFPSDAEDVEAGITEDLVHLKTLCVMLSSDADDQKIKSKGKSKAGTDMSFNREEHYSEVIAEILGELSKGDGVSTFEFIGSGAVPALLNYFSCGHFSKEKILNADLYKLRRQALKRYKSFVTVALPFNLHEGSQAPMTVLIQKLQNALSSLDRFPVVLSQSSSGISHLSSGLSALSQPLKLRLWRAQVEKSLCDFSTDVVLIDPMASLADVEDFLWPRVQRAETGQKPPSTGASGTTPGTAASSRSTLPPTARSRHSTRSRSFANIGKTTKNNSSQEKLPSSSSTSKGKGVLKPAQEKSRGPQTRNASRGQTALEKQPVIGVSSSEDEDMDISPVEMDDALVIEDGDISDDEDDMLEAESLPIGTPNTVHEFSDSTEATSITRTNLPSGSSSKSVMLKGSDYVDFRGGNSSAARGAMSFPANAMAGLASAKERSIIGRTDRRGSLLSGSSDPPRLIFTAGGKQLNRHLTICQAIQQHLMVDDDNGERCNGSDVVSSGGSSLWSDIHTIIYQKAKTLSHTTSIGLPNGSTPSKSTKAGSSHRMSLLDSILQAELPCDLEKSNPTYNILALLRVLEVLNQLAPRLRVQALSDDFAEGKIPSLPELSGASGARVPSEEFVNSKLTPKLARQIQDALALCSGSLPSWCYQLTKACPFLFSFETRRQYFYSTSFGLSRALYHLQQQGIDGQHGPVNQRGVRVGRLQRQKVRVSRTRILDSAKKVMEMYSSQKAVLEIEYFGEVGTGLGPTLEFYTLLSHDLQKVGLGIWRTNSSPERASIEVEEDKQKNRKYCNVSGMGSNPSEKDLVQAPLGLFPCPWPSNADTSAGSQFSKVIENFRLVGRAMAKALQDGRLLDLPMSTAFYKLVIGQTLHLYDILSIDPDFGKILQELLSLVCRKQYLESMGGNNSKAIADLRFRGVPVEDLSLDFTLPGYPDYILKPGDQNVDIYNLEEYIALIVDATVKTGITRQMEAFRAGFKQVFDVASLQIFSPHELDYLICGCRELWKAETLVDHIKFDHGYTAKSPEVVNLLEIMGEFTPEQQRAFCQFVTGAPKLPPGGLAVLNPKLTIVRKHCSTPSTTTPNGTGLSEPADDDLPSVMTCANYLKLPPYSTKEIMYKKLLYAISEGQGSFDLS